jgi:hypothetical protein
MFAERMKRTGPAPTKSDVGTRWCEDGKGETEVEERVRKHEK